MVCLYSTMSTVSGGDTRRLEVTQQLTIIWKCPHMNVCWLTLAVGEDLSSDAKAEHLDMASPCCLRILDMACWLGSKSRYPKKQEEEAANLLLPIF